MDSKTVWKIILILELAAAAAVIILDLFMPTLVMLAMIIVSLLLRRESITTLGFHKPESVWKMVGIVFLVTVLLQAFQFGVTMPILNRLTGTTIDYSDFAGIQGNLGRLLTLLALSWTLAAIGEEMAYRGYLQKLSIQIFGSGTPGILLAVGISSLLFGIAHTEQGIIGVVMTAIDAVVYSWLKWKFKNNLWASVLAHGFGNSIGLIIFFFTGPLYGLW